MAGQGRPKKEENLMDETNLETTPQALNIEAIIKEAVAIARREWEAENKKTKVETLVVDEEDLPETTKIEIISNVINKFYLKDRDDAPLVNTIFGNRGDKFRLNLVELNSIKRNKPYLLSSGMLAISKVIGDSKGTKLQQLLEELSLTKLYSTSALITPMTIDAIFDSKVSYNDFDVAVRSNLVIN